MNKLWIAAVLVITNACLAWAQDASAPDSRPARLFLKTGFVVEGQLVASSDQGVTLLIRGHEFKYRADQIDHFEAAKAKPTSEKPKLAVLGAPKASAWSLKGPSLDPAVRSRVDRTLAQMGTISIVEREALARELARRPGIGAYLASQLEQLKDEILPYVGRVLWDLQENDAAPYLLAALDSDRPAVVAQALLLCGRLENSPSPMQIRRFLTDRRPRVRAAAIEALRTIGDERSLPDFLPMMRAEEICVRAAAIPAAFELARKAGKLDLAVEALREGIDRARGAVLADLVDAAGRFGGRGVVDSLIRQLGEGERDIRIRSAAALEALKDPSSLAAINQRLSVEDSIPVLIQLVRAAAAFRSTSSVEPLIFLLRSRDGELMKESLRVLQATTQEDFGTSYADWIAWWDRVKLR